MHILFYGLVCRQRTWPPQESTDSQKNAQMRPPAARASAIASRAAFRPSKCRFLPAQDWGQLLKVLSRKMTLPCLLSAALHGPEQLALACLLGASLQPKVPP